MSNTKTEIQEEIARLETELFWLDSQDIHDEVDLSFIDQLKTRLKKLRSELKNLESE